MNDADHARKFEAIEDGTLSPHEFSHLDHVGTAYVALSRHDFFEALSRFADGLRRLVQRAGCPGNSTPLSRLPA